MSETAESESVSINGWRIRLDERRTAAMNYVVIVTSGDAGEPSGPIASAHGSDWGDS